MIFYFSGTGNTRWVAQQIAEAIGEEMRSIPELIREGRYEFRLKEGERIGICFPTHGWQPPGIVRQFVRNLKIQPTSPGQAENHYCWVLTTCGDNMGEAMTILQRELPLRADALFSVIMPESYVCLPLMYTDPEEREKQKIEEARRQVRHIAQVVIDRQHGVEELEKGAFPRLYSYVIGGYFNKRMITDKKFTVDEDTCIKCGKCAKVCPVDNITGTPPAWKHDGRCTCCLACYHHCPTHAINYGERTRKRGQYYFNRRGDQK